MTFMYFRVARNPVFDWLSSLKAQSTTDNQPDLPFGRIAVYSALCKHSHQGWGVPFLASDILRIHYCQGMLSQGPRLSRLDHIWVQTPFTGPRMSIALALTLTLTLGIADPGNDEPWEWWAGTVARNPRSGFSLLPCLSGNFTTSV